MTTKNTNKRFSEKLLGEKFSFAIMISGLRTSENISQVEFAKKLGLSKQHLCDIENGRKQVSIERAKKFAKILKFPEDFFAKQIVKDLLAKEGLLYELVPIRKGSKEKLSQKSTKHKKAA